MTSLANPVPRISAERWFALCVSILAAITVIRLAGLAFSQVDLFFDESQYWAWSREPAFGYFSKPPLLAWVIAASDFVCGSAEACVRSPSPVFHFGTALAIYGIAAALYDEQTAFWSAMLLTFGTGLAFSSRIISTDVPLLFFWAVALLAYVKLLQGGGRAWGAVLGVAFGLGMLAKYAMIYFLLGVAGAALIDRDARALLRSSALWIAAPITVLLILPNVIWNASNGFVTLQHVGHNISGGGGPAFDPLRGLEFIASQFAVFGPVTFAVLLIIFVRIMHPEITRADRLMVCFAVPALALVTATAFTTRAFPNWAAVSCVSATAVVAAVLVRRGAWRWIALSLAIGVIAQIALIAGDANARRLSLPFLSKPDVYARTMGWSALGTEVAAIARRTGAGTIAVERRDDIASLIYYLRDLGRPVLAWNNQAGAADHFEMSRPLTPDAPEPVLLISHCGDAQRLARHYRNVEPLGPFTVSTGPHSSRSYFAFLLSGVTAETSLRLAC